MVKVSEVFVSRQGEGFLMGQRCLFIRVSECNLIDHCSGFCDTGKLVGVDVEIDDLCKSVREIIDESDIRNVVITGGEPTIYLDEFLELISKIDRDVLWQFETNGVLPIDLEKVMKSIKIDKNRIMFVVSPKNGTFINETYYGLYKTSLMSGNPCVVFKLVVMPVLDKIDNSNSCPFFSATDISDIVNFLLDNGVNRNDIWLMPFAKSVDELDNTAKIVYEIAKLFDVNYSDRLHIRFNFK